MKITTLKSLIEESYNRHNSSHPGDDIKDFYKEVIKLIDLYIEDNNNNVPVYPYVVPNNQTLTTYGDICSCNPKNGGNGVCGCTIGNQLLSPTVKSTLTNNIND